MVNKCEVEFNKNFKKVYMGGVCHLDGVRLGGAWIFISGPNAILAIAIVHLSSSRGGSGAFHIRVPGLALKFWMMISWRWPCLACDSRRERRAWRRSGRDSPKPMRRPEVKGTDSMPAGEEGERKGGGKGSYDKRFDNIGNV